jgi:hypothetical protein
MKYLTLKNQAAGAKPPKLNHPVLPAGGCEAQSLPNCKPPCQPSHAAQRCLNPTGSEPIYSQPAP